MRVAALLAPARIAAGAAPDGIRFHVGGRSDSRDRVSRRRRVRREERRAAADGRTDAGGIRARRALGL